MKKFLLTLLILALVAALAALVLAPVVTRQRRLRDGAKVIDRYRDAADRLSPEDCDAMLARARDYNQALGGNPWADPCAPAGGEPADGEAYAAQLNPAGDGVMAVLEMPKLGLSMAVCHDGGADPSPARVMHAAQSRLPAGDGEGPCLLYATRERFFNPLGDLNRLIEGDCFFLRVLQEVQTYQVFQVALVTPGELEGFQSDGNECALVAATAVNGEDMRLVVRGRRVSRLSANPTDDSRPLPTGVPALIFAVPVALAGLLLLAVVEGLRRIIQRQKRRRMKL